MAEEKKNQWNLVPQYNKSGIFLGYALKDKKGQFVQDSSGKSNLIISTESNAWQFKTSDGYPEGCVIKYKDNTWKVTDEQLRRHMAPQVFYITQTKEGVFVGYDVKQQGTVIGHLKPDSVQYEENKSGGKNVFWTDASGEKHFIEKLTKEQANSRIKKSEMTDVKLTQQLSDQSGTVSLSAETLKSSLGQKLSENSQKVTEDIQEISQKMQKDSVLIYD